MGRRPDSETDRRAEEAAYLAGELKLSHQQIATRMKMSISNVSRLLARARELACYREEIVRTFVPDKISEERVAALRSPGRPHRLMEALQDLSTESGVRVRRVEVIG